MTRKWNEWNTELSKWIKSIRKLRYFWKKLYCTKRMKLSFWIIALGFWNSLITRWEGKVRENGQWLPLEQNEEWLKNIESIFNPNWVMKGSARHKLEVQSWTLTLGQHFIKAHLENECAALQLKARVLF